MAKYPLVFARKIYPLHTKGRRAEKAEFDADVAKHGALAGGLRERIQIMRDTDWTDVTVYLRYPPRPAALDPEKHTLSEVLERERTIQAVKPLGTAHSLVAEFAGGLRNVAILDSAVFTCRANKGQLEILRRHPHVGQVIFKTEYHPTATYAFHSLANSAYNPSSGIPTTFRGQGINAATFETGVANTTSGSGGQFFSYGNLLACLGVPGYQVDPSPSTPPWTDWEHSHQTFKCLWQTAPFANHFHKNMRILSGPYAGNIGSDLSIEQNALFITNNQIRSLSMSLSMSFLLESKTCPSPQYPWLHPKSIVPFSATVMDMIDADEWAFRYPYPVLSNPAGNWGSEYEVNWQCYNGLSVGNVRHTNLSHYEILSDPNLDVCDPRPSCTQTRNPRDLWGGTGRRPPLSGPDGTVVYSYSSGDREMPYLVVPGMPPDAGGANMVDQTPSCVEGLSCGTSYSAPTLNGIVTCVLSSDSRMLNRPHAVWATILATAQNVTDGEWSSYFDGKDGAGVVSGSSAVAFARNHAEPSPNQAAVVNGIVSSTFDHTTPAGTTIQYNILIPNPKPAGKHLRVVLTWTSDPIRPTQNWLSDLDLSVGNSTIGFPWWSTSFNGNVEIVDPPSSELTAGGTYEAKINLWANRQQRPSAGGISGGILKYALAWTWVKDHAD